VKETNRKQKEQAREIKGMTDEIRAQLDGVFGKYRGARPELIPVLQDVQSVLGFLPPAAIAGVAKFLRMSESAVYGVATFYAQFHLTRQGKHKIRVCQGTACHVRGGKQILETVRKRLGIRAGQTTPDYQYSLDRVACFGSCALGPVVVVNEKVHGRMTPKKTEKLLETLK
jgi:NADH-quinone oxidoreductase subunit E